VLELIGPAALSPFRLAKLLARVREAVPSVRGVSARFIHFADTSGELDGTQLRTLENLLTYGPRAASARQIGKKVGRKQTLTERFQTLSGIEER
jgi:phosphoribosylformylglycinamidine synthase